MGKNPFPRSSGADHGKIGNAKTGGHYLYAHIGKRAYSPLFLVIHEQMRQHRLQIALIVLAHIALLDPPVHIVAVGAVARSEVLAHGYKLRLGGFVDGQSRHALIIALNWQFG